MHIAIAAAIAAVFGFAAGVASAKLVLSDAKAIKSHVTDEVGKLREDLKSAFARIGSKL